MKWVSDGVLYLYSPSLQDCIDVISQLTAETLNKKQDYIYLCYSSPDSTLVLMSQIYRTEIKKLEISDTPLNEDHMYCISECVVNNQLKELHLINTNLANNILSTLIAAIIINTSLEKLQLWNIETTEDDVINTSKVLSVNKTLQRLTLINCGITDNGVQYLSNSLLLNSTLSELSLL